MKKHILIFVLFSSLGCYSQDFSPYTLIDDFSGTFVIRDLKIVDTDQDGDLDIITTTNRSLKWYENLDGLGDFGPAILIDNYPDASAVASIAITDLNQDSLPDVVVSNFGVDAYFWYRNLGNGTFAASAVIASVVNAVSTTASDIDGDGDLDLVLGVTNSSGLYWVEHLDGQGTFGPLNLIDASISQARLQLVADLDGDGDMDILSNTSSTPLRVVWYENTDSAGDFSVQHIVTSTGFYQNAMALGDIDNDGQVDHVGNTIEEFTRSKGNIEEETGFEEEFIISEEIPFGPMRLVDFDKDGDLDILMSSPLHEIAWLENLDGLGTFSSIITIETGLSDPNVHAPGDIDGDGDLDLVIVSQSANGPKFLTWLSNETPLSIENLALKAIRLYPNPTRDILNIQIPEGISIDTIQVRDISGKEVIQVPLSSSKHAINMGSLAKGMYFVSLSVQNTTIVKKVIVQ